MQAWIVYLSPHQIKEGLRGKGREGDGRRGNEIKGRGNGEETNYYELFMYVTGMV